MALTKLQFRPGINQDLTSYTNEGGWRDCDKVRFRLGYPEKLGGWQKYTVSTYLGSARSLHNWIGLDGSNFLGVGTHLKYYIEEGGNFNDITPTRSVTSAGDVTFSAANTEKKITVTDPGHGAGQFDFVTFSGAVSLGGVITADVLNKEYQIQRILNGSQYEVTSAIAADASDTSNGGSSVAASYQINVGLDTTVGGTGFGSGLWSGVTGSALQTTLNEGGTLSATDTTVTVTDSSPDGHQIVANDVIIIDDELMLVTNVVSNDLTVVRAYAGTGDSSNVNDAGHGGGNAVTDAVTHADGSVVKLVKGNPSASSNFSGWGDAASGGITTEVELRTYSQDNFGENLIINPRDSGLFYWGKINGTGSRAVPLNSVSGTKRSIPTIAKQVLVSDQDRHVIAFGADGIGGASDVDGDGAQDPLLIRFSTQEDFLDWYPVSENTAGDLRLGAGSTFMQAVETKREILVWTDTSLHSMRFIGPPFTFGIQQLAQGITIASPNAAVASEDFVFWMGIDSFFIYAGQTAQLPCTVKTKVFGDFNLSQIQKVTSGVNSEFSEVTWFYPSADSEENNRYVTYNYLEKVWTFGSIQRTAWLDRGTRIYPVSTGGGYLYNHELGYDDDGAPMNSFIESSVMDMGDGDHFAYIRRLIPDLTFTGSTALSSPQATFTLKSRNFPGSNFKSTSSDDAIRTSVSPVEEYTNQLDLRVRGRSFALRVESDALGSKWKLGSPRVDLRQDGRR